MERTYTNKMIVQAVANYRKLSNGKYGPVNYRALALQIATDTGLKAPSKTLMNMRVSGLVAHGFLSCERHHCALRIYTLDVTDKGLEMLA